MRALRYRSYAARCSAAATFSSTLRAMRKAAAVYAAALVIAMVGAAGAETIELQHESRLDAPAPEAEAEAAPPKLQIPHIVGPKRVSLGNNTSIDLPAGMILIERDAARAELEKEGSNTANVVGAVLSETAGWSMIIEYDGSGYVDDSDADELHADELLESYKEGTAKQNEVRRQKGVPDLFVDDWSEKPRYERAQHRLVWGLNVHDKDGKVVNYFTRVLGRGGYLSLNLIDAPDAIEAAKKESAVLLDKVGFDAGNRYEDFREGDRKSGIGLRGLVLGGAGVAVASKLGLIAKILLALKKGIIFIVAGIAGLFKWIFGRKKSDT